MKSLTATLLAEQKKPRATPYVGVLVEDRLGADTRLTWSELYSGSEGDAPHAIAIAGDDSLVRWRASGGQVYRQRVTDPTVGSQWSAWSATGWACSSTGQLALCAHGSYVWAFYLSPAADVLYCRESSDYGATFGSAVVVYTAPSGLTMESVAAAVQTSGEPVVFFSRTVESSQMVSARPGRSSDDAYFEPGGSGWSLKFFNQMGKDVAGNAFSFAARFPALGLEQGASIVSAKVSIEAFGSGQLGGSGINVTIKGLDQDDAATFSSRADFDARPRTSASVAWSPANWTPGQVYDTPDLKSIVQEIVDRPGYDGGALALEFRLASSPTARMCVGYHYEDTPEKTPVLSVEYATYPSDLYVCQRSGGSWGAASSWGKTARERVKGLGVSHDGDYNLLLAGSDPGREASRWYLWATAWGDGFDLPPGTWADPVVIEATDEGTPCEYSWPSVVYLDVRRALFTCSYKGSNGYDRVHRLRVASGGSHTTSSWTDPAPFKAQGGEYGIGLVWRPGGDGYVYAACSCRAWRAPQSSASQADLSARVVKYRLVDRWLGHKGSGVSIDLGELIAPELYGELWLDNCDGALGSLGSGEYAAVKRGSMVMIRPGYVTPAGNEWSDWPHLWIEDYEYVVDFQGRSYLVLHLAGPWMVLSAMAARRQYHWADDEASVYQIAARLLGLAGFDLLSAGEASTEVGSVRPWFVVHPGEDLRGALLRVLSKVPDFIYFAGASGYLKELKEDEASDYTYGGEGGHTVIAGRYGWRSPGVNHVEVFAGEDLFGDALDYGEIDLLGHRLHKVLDYGYDSSAECAARAEAQLRKHLATGRMGELVTLPNVGLQLFDVITLTDGRAGISSELYRVRGIEELYDTTKAPVVYRQVVTLGGS
jgi:hypothetical protein